LRTTIEMVRVSSVSSGVFILWCLSFADGTS
jgi:hypothetical protein